MARTFKWLGPLADGGSGAWDIAGNWQNLTDGFALVPVAGDTVQFTTASGTISGSGAAGVLQVGGTGPYSFTGTVAAGTSLALTGALAVAGGTLSAGGVIGVNNGASLSITAGGTLLATEAAQVGHFTVQIANSGTATALVSGVGSLLDTGGNPLGVAEGPGSTGSLTVAGGAHVVATSYNPNEFLALRVGRSGTGSLTVTDAGSTVTAFGYSVIGRAGQGTLTVQNHGSFLALNGPFGGDGGLGIGTGQPSAATYINGAGTLVVNSFGLVHADNYVTVGGRGVNGVVSVSGGGTVEATGQFTFGQSGTIGGTNYVGNAVVTVGAGGVLRALGAHVQGNSAINIGSGLGSTATVTVSGAGALIDSGGDSVIIGNFGQASVTVSNGGSLSAGTPFPLIDQGIGIGNNAGGHGTLTVTGATSHVSVAGIINVGQLGQGALTIEAGATVDTTWLRIGRQAGSTGTVLVTGAGSAMFIEQGLLLNGPGTGAFAIANHGLVQAGNSLTMNGLTTLSLDSTGMLEIGGSGHAVGGSVVVDAGGKIVGQGTLSANVINNGSIDASGGRLVVFGQISGAGALGIEAGATLDVGSVSAGQRVHFNGAGTLRLASVASFAGTIDMPSLGSVIDLSGVAASSAVVVGSSILRVGLIGGGSLDLAVSGGVNGTSYLTTSDGFGGSDVVIPQTPAFSVVPASAVHAEGNAGSTAFTFTVSRAGSLAGTDSVQWSVAGASTGLGIAAASAADFTGGVLPSGSLTFAPGQASQTVTVNVAGDTAAEADEGFRVSLSSPSGVSLLGSPASADAVILDDDTAPAPTNRVIFAAASPTRGYELWVTDGSSGGTSLVADLRPGPVGSYPQHFTAFRHGVLFNADAGVSSRELWYSDGTAAGTHVVEPISLVPDGNAGNPRYVTVVGDKAFFTGRNAENLRELWVTDGTSAGTSMVMDINAASRASPRSLTAFNGKLLFNAFDGTLGRELWISDGTAAGTSMVTDINPGGSASNPAQVTVLGGLAVFGARNGASGYELWVTDGSSAGTSLLADINPGGASSDPKILGVVGGRAVFRATDPTHGTELWVTDGTSGGTTLLADIVPGSVSGDIGSGGVVVGNRMLFTAAAPGGKSLWSTDGTSAGTYLIDTTGALSVAFNPPGSAGGDYAGGAVALGNTAIFAGYDAAHGIELWVSDGTVAGTSLLKDINPGGTGSLPENLVVMGNQVVFTAMDATHGAALWVTDGTAAGTSLLGDPYPGGNAGSRPIRVGNGHPGPRIAAAGTLEVFNAMAPSPYPGETAQRVLWVTDGSAAGTSMLSSAYGAVVLQANVNANTFGNNQYPMLRLGSKVLFDAWDATHGYELWVTDGTSAGTSLVRDIQPGTGNAFPTNFGRLGSNKALFSAYDSTHGYELWVTDGTAAGTSLVRDINPGVGQSYPTTFGAFGFTTLGDKVLFNARDAAHGDELWVTDGSTFGTTLLKDINPTAGAGSYARGVGVVGSRVVFFANDGTAPGLELWSTDGTSAGTTQVSSVQYTALRRISNPLPTLAGKGAFFAGDDGTHGQQLWVSDGLANGTSMVALINPTGDAAPTDMVALGNTVLFAANDGTHGRELWSSDGTAGGTSLLKDIVAGAGGSTPYALTVLGSQVLFQATDAAHGAELWISDGTAAGTSLLKDIAPGAAGSSPLAFSVQNGRAFFEANDGATGYELWVTDGTAAGTSLVKDLVNNPAGPRAYGLTAFTAAAASPGVTHLAISAADASKAEGNSGSTAFTFTVARSGDTTVASGASWSVAGSGGSPANAADFAGGVLPSGTVGFAAGEVSKTLTVLVAGDTTIEPNEGFTVTLAAPTGGATLDIAAASGSIVNDDSSFSVAATDAVKPEGSDPNNPVAFTFTVTRSGDTSQTQFVTGGVTGSGANPADAADFSGGVLPGGTLTFAPGVVSQVVSVDVQGDSVVEPDEGFTLSLLSASGGAAIGTASASGTILNDDSAAPSFAIAATSASKAEGNGGATPFVFTVTRAGGTGGTNTVAWSATGLSPNSVNAADFAGGIVPSGTLTFAPGVLTQTITANIAGDTIAEADEQFRVVLSAPSDGTITTASASGTVLNDDTNLSIASTTGSRPEGNSGATPFLFTVTRSGLLSAASTVQWYTTGPGPGLASVGANDFVGASIPSGTLSFAAGVASQVITVDIAGDTVLEPDEFFTVGLRNATGAVITTPTALAKIVNDEAAFAIAPTSAVQSEGNAGSQPFTFTVTRSGNIAGTHTISWGLTGAASGASANAEDFAGGTVPTGRLTFAPGVTTQTITVNVRGDTTVEPDEGFRVVLSNASAAATITAQTASGTILNDDTGFAVSIAVGSRPEGDSGATPFVFTVTRSGLLSGANSVQWYTTGPGPGLASVGALDFVGGVVPGGTLSFAAGQTTQTITINIQGDTLLEADEFFTVGLRNPTGGATVIVPTALAKIVNDDTAFSIAGTDAVKAEGNSGSTPFTFTVTRSGNIAGTHSVGWLISGAQPNSVGPSDFVSGAPLSGGLIFAPGEVAKTITVQVQGDAFVEPDEHFVVLLRNASAGAAITVNNAGATILNDDSAPAGDTASPPLAQADLTGDGVADTLRLGTSGDLYLLDGASGVQAALSQSAAGLAFVAASDLNGDGRADLLLQSANGGLYDWTMDGATVQRADLITTLASGSTVAQVSGADILLHSAAAQPWLLLQMNGGMIAATAAYDARPVL